MSNPHFPASPSGAARRVSNGKIKLSNSPLGHLESLCAVITALGRQIRDSSEMEVEVFMTGVKKPIPRLGHTSRLWSQDTSGVQAHAHTHTHTHTYAFIQ